MPLTEDTDARAAPSRHGEDVARSRAMATRLRWMVRGDAEPTPAQWQSLGAALWAGDPLADDVVAWVNAGAGALSWSQVFAAIAGRDEVVPASSPLAAYLTGAAQTPAWFDARRARRGARVLQGAGLHAMRVLRDAGLMAGYQASAINQTLLLTGALHKGAQRRVADTTSWWLACTGDDGMAVGGPGYRMTLKVRLMHAMVRAQLANRPTWQSDRYGLPINQVDMQATYLAFSVVQLLALRTTGILLTRQQGDDVMHLWRYIGWLMGVDERWLCDDEQTGRRLLYHNLLSQAPPDEGSVALARALMDEPLARHYPWAPQWVGRFNRARHLSIVRWFVGRRGMVDLGLPLALPWYPILMLGPYALASACVQLVPALGRLAVRRGRAQQVAYLQVLHGPREALQAGQV